MRTKSTVNFITIEDINSLEQIELTIDPTKIYKITLKDNITRVFNKENKKSLKQTLKNHYNISDMCM